MRYICTKNKAFFENIGDYNYCRIEDIKLNNTIAIDCETEGLDPVKGDKIFCIQVADKYNCYIIDLQSYPQMPGEDLVYTFDEVLPYIKDKKLVGQNLTFDLQFFFLNGWFPEVVGDCYVGSLILYNGYPPNFRHDLGSIFSREMNITISKFEQKNISKIKLSQPSTIEYSFIDVERLLELHDVILQKLKDYGSLPTYELHCKFTRVLAYMQVCGLPLDENLWREKMKIDANTSSQKANEIIEYIWDNIPKYRNNQLSLFETVKKIKPQLSSNKQMIPVFKDLGINVETEDKKNKGEKKESIEEDVLKKSNHEFVKLWLEYRKAEHSKTTFGQNILDQIYNGRLYSSFKIILDTGRIASRAGSINFLNFPSTPIVRKCFVSKKGYKMVVADHQAMEGRTTADITQDPVMIDSIINGKDLHAAYARLLNPEIAELSDEVIAKEYKHLRQAAKAPRFA